VRPTPDPTPAGAPPLDPEEGNSNAADNSPLGSNSRRRFGRSSGFGHKTQSRKNVRRPGSRPTAWSVAVRATFRLRLQDSEPEECPPTRVQAHGLVGGGSGDLPATHGDPGLAVLSAGWISPLSLGLA